MGLNKYSLYNDMWFNFNYTTNNPEIIRSAEELLKEIDAYTGTKDNVKKEFMVKLLLNLKVSHRTHNVISIMRTPEYYSKIPDRYRHETQSYEITKRITDLLVKHEYIYFKKGMIKKDKYKYGEPSKIRPLEKLLPILNKITSDDFISEPRDLIILRDADKKDIDYKDTTDTQRWRADLEKYNNFLTMNEVSLAGLTRDLINKHSSYFQNYDLVDTFNIDTIDESAFAKIVLKYLQMRRIFNINFTKGGRFYGGVESIPSELRPLLNINGSPTIEFDYASYQIRMLYHKRKINYIQDAYSDLCTGNILNERDMYKLVALIVLNSSNEKAALKGIRNKFSEQGLMDSKSKTDTVLKAFIKNFEDHHPQLKKYFYSGIGSELQFTDSEITNEILKYFTNKGILVLSVHDSFIIAEEHKDVLLMKMIKEYKKVFRFAPVIK